MFEASMFFAEQQALTGTSDTKSANVFFAGFPKRKVYGSNTDAALAVYVTGIGGTAPTFRARLVGADNEALTTNPIIIADTGVTPTLAAGDLPLVFELGLENQAEAKSYYGMIFTLGGTSPTATVNALITAGAHSAGLR